MAKIAAFLIALIFMFIFMVATITGALQHTPVFYRGIGAVAWALVCACLADRFGWEDDDDSTDGEGVLVA